MQPIATKGLATAPSQFNLVGSSTTQDAQCCQALSQSCLASQTYFPDTISYNDRIESYWSVSASLSPTCMVLPTSPEDVTSIIQTITANECSFGIRGGGHGSFAFSNSVDAGITIDFGFMNSTTYNSDMKIASIQPGSNWQAVYETLAPYGVTVAGGRAGTVGVGGFITGGGNSFHSASHGFACDTVQNFEVVLANGSIVNANADDNADLWQALKGGSGNFGLITRFDLYAIEFPSPNATDIWGGILVFDLNATNTLIDNYVKFAENVESDQNSSSIIYWAYIPAAGGMVLNAALENTVNAVRPPAFDSNIWFTGAYKNDARVLKYAVQKHEEIVALIEAEMSEDSGFNTLCMFQPITQTLVQHSAEKGGNMLGLEDRVKDGNGVMFLATLAVDGADNEAKALPHIREWFDAVDGYAASLDANWNWRYLNYAYKDQDPMKSYGDKSVEELRRVAAKYDPSQVFQSLRKSGFKIPRARFMDSV
ncbi:FAD binding domain-containing protein [Seiridium cupressi]